MQHGGRRCCAGTRLCAECGAGPLLVSADCWDCWTLGSLWGCQGAPACTIRAFSLEKPNQPPPAAAAHLPP